MSTTLNVLLSSLAVSIQSPGALRCIFSVGSKWHPVPMKLGLWLNQDVVMKLGLGLSQDVVMKLGLGFNQDVVRQLR